MANGFDKLEKFFGVSRRREKASYERAAGRKRMSVANSSCPIPPASEGPFFPSPSYLRPTSMHMVPKAPTREPESPLLSQQKERSQSLPEAHNQPPRCSSSYYGSSDEEWKTRSDSTRTSSIASGSDHDLPSTPRLSEFRFPENAIFRQEEMARLSTDLSPRAVPRVDLSPGILGAEAQRIGLLDWSPRYISLLFNPLDHPAAPDGKNLTSAPGVAESVILMPSPSISSSKPSPTTPRSATYSTRGLHNQSSAGVSERKFSLFPKQYSPFKVPASQISPTPTSDSEDEHRWPVLDHSRPLSAVSPPTQFGPTLSTGSSKTSAIIYEGKSPRETWGHRLDDLQLDTNDPKEAKSNEGVPRSRLRRIQSAATLSAVTSKIAKESILLAPTFDDFYALSDDDIAEARPATPAPNFRLPRSPQPKCMPKTPGPRKRGMPVAIKSTPTAAINPRSGQITPPDTPTDTQFLALTQPASHPGALGALMVAGIAKTYNFDVVYVVSLWPSNNRNIDPSRKLSPASSVRDFASEGSIIAQPNSGATGRFLAAFGLNEVASPGSPFRIHTKIHLQSLGSEDWNEYRNPTKVPHEISRGWICSFYGDHVPTAGTTGEAGLSNVMNRGIVFAAYTTRNNKSMIPTKASPEKDEIQKRLRLDAKTLVDALVEKAR